ncbi:MAG: FecR domain-containing protein [Proteobacteria bacterium]|nr:FecR domain-containing protein [Pseudomonadota bacterium]
MTDLHQQRHSGSVDEQAADWCLRLAEAHLQPAEWDELECWMADPRHRKALEEAVTVWRSVEDAAEQPELIQLRSRALESLRRVNRRRWTDRITPGWRWAGALACLLILGLLGVFLHVHRSPDWVFETGIAERRSVRLADGSQLSLDAASRVEIRFLPQQRDLRLISGRARFDVAKDPLRPFNVTVGDKVVVAVGTSFSVELVQQRLHVVLYEGRVLVVQKSHPASPASLSETELSPGHELWSPVGGAVATVAPADLPRSESWEAGQLSFINEPLSRAVERINRYSQTKLRVTDTTAAAITINGVYNTGDTAAFIEGLRVLSPVRITAAPGQVLISAAPEAQK